MEKLPLSLIDRLPYKLNFISKFKNRYILKDQENRLYHLYELNRNEYAIYLELCKSKSIEKCIFELKEENFYYLLYSCLNKTSEVSSICEKMLPLYEKIFDDFKYSIHLKKEHFVHLNNIYKVLDNRFTYFEMRIRELELSIKKDDVTWVILSKYHILLDAKVYLYDLQQDIFSFIDKKINVDYGVIFRQIDIIQYKNTLIEPFFNIYYGPIGMLMARYFLYFDHLKNYNFFVEKLKKIDDFNSKYFCFMCLYIYILNVNLDIILNPYNINIYLQTTKKISDFLKYFGDYAKK